MPRRGKLTEGSLLGVPLAGGAWGLGVVARVTDDGWTCLGYFYGPYPDLPRVEQAAAVRAKTAILVGLFGARGYQTGRWLLIGLMPGFDRAAWPLPEFRSADPLRGGFQKVIYGEDLMSPRFTSMRGSDSALMPDAGLMGDGFVEIRLSRLCGIRSGSPPVEPGSVSDADGVPRRVSARDEAGDQATLGEAEGEAHSGEIQAVLLHFPAGAARTEGSREPLDAVEDALTTALAAAGVGDLDGDESSASGVTVFLYGPDAEALLRVVQGVLVRFDLPAGSEATIRYGGPGAHERRIALV